MFLKPTPSWKANTLCPLTGQKTFCRIPLLKCWVSIITLFPPQRALLITQERLSKVSGQSENAQKNYPFTFLKLKSIPRKGTGLTTAQKMNQSRLFTNNVKYSSHLRNTTTCRSGQPCHQQQRTPAAAGNKRLLLLFFYLFHNSC